MLIPGNCTKAETLRSGSQLRRRLIFVNRDEADMQRELQRKRNQKTFEVTDDKVPEDS
jgi:hypothetical protein